MARKTGQIIRRGAQMWMVRIYVGRDPETRKRHVSGAIWYRLRDEIRRCSRLGET
jgi:hypothetical protein